MVGFFLYFFMMFLFYFGMNGDGIRMLMVNLIMFFIIFRLYLMSYFCVDWHSVRMFMIGFFMYFMQNWLGL